MTQAATNISSEELVRQTIISAKDRPESWWITKRGTVLIRKPDIVLWVGGGIMGLKIGVGMPPVFGKNDIAGITISIADRFRLWSAYLEVKKQQEHERVRIALASAGYVCHD